MNGLGATVKRTGVDPTLNWWTKSIGYVLATAVAVTAGVFVAINGPFAAALILAICLAPALVWLSKEVGLILAVLLPLLLAGLLIPLQLQLLAEALLIVYVAYLAAVALVKRNPAAPAAIAALCVFGLWLLLMLNPNVPSIAVGLQGSRKISYAFVGLALGLLWPRGSTLRVERIVIRMLLLAGFGVVAIHILAPGIESSFARSAAESTEEFAGHARVAGFFAGPFHVALLGSFLALSGWYILLGGNEPPWVSVCCIGVGLILVRLAEVRTGYLAVGLGFLITPLVTHGHRLSRAQRLAISTLLCAALAILLASSTVHTAALSSVPDLTHDSRVENRVTTIREAEELIKESPIVGWGSGSAGATLGPDFAEGRHVTSHSQVLGFLVEGGVIGLLVALLPFILLTRTVSEVVSLAHPALAAVVALVVFGLTGEISEAMPISLFLLLLIGLRGRVSAWDGSRGQFVA